MANRSCFYLLLLLVVAAFQTTKSTTVLPPPQCRSLVASTSDRLEFLCNLIIYKTELYLRSSVGRGINDISPGLVQGPVPIGARVANLDNATRNVIEELGLNGVGHLRAIVETTSLKAPIPMPQLNLSSDNYAGFLKLALNVSTLTPPLDFYNNTSVFLVATGVASSILQQYYAEIIPRIIGNAQQELVARIALSESTGFGVIRARLNTMVNSTVTPYTFTVANLTNLVAQVINGLGGCGVKDEGLIVPLQRGAENRTTSNVVQADVNSLAFPRTEREILRFYFGTGNATRPGGVFPAGVNGTLFRRMVLLRLA